MSTRRGSPVSASTAPTIKVEITTPCLPSDAGRLDGCEKVAIKRENESKFGRRPVAIKKENQRSASRQAEGGEAAVPAWAVFRGLDEAKGEEPYPSLKSPSSEACAAAMALMAAEYGLPSSSRQCPKERPNLLDCLVGTILSQNTTDVNSRRAFGSLKAALPSWRAVLEAEPEVMIEVRLQLQTRRPCALTSGRP
jgi:hypothetical protein